MNTVVTVVTDSMIVPNGKYTMQIKDKKTNTQRDTACGNSDLNNTMKIVLVLNHYMI